ncbi:hypothetical protein ANCCEY_14912 [Ancylostoma ceylanicum]|uniref:ATPase AAA-type core domain-containing protein n=1 Tax=Ancylostoma ceylanicum TaxID=53326 RepID=A0A0D6L4C1_9BILA|nr:hypothetical protein ANCCEY_14912 [Ancylostoma ceylanicum]
MIIYNGDTLCIPVVDLFTKELSRYYFKVNCDDSPCILDATTSFYQISSTNAYLPYAARGDLLQIPSSMRDVVEKMRNICLAHDAVDDKPLVLLLFGASGSGKRLIATHLAMETHRNLIEMSCFDLWSQVTAQSEAKLNTLFQKATSFEPCILHLTAVDVLGFDASTNAIGVPVILEYPIACSL